jgi:parallel beta-helix repeat protein
VENFVGGKATFSNCTISGNSASRAGGGLADYGTATLTNCTISGNQASTAGGGVSSGYRATTTLTDCTISGNSAKFGGALGVAHAVAALIGCTVSGNSASYGGGVDSGYYSTTALTGCTVSGNSATIQGGGLSISGVGTPAHDTITDTIIAGNSAAKGSDVFGTVPADQGYNLIGIGDGSDGFTAAGDHVGTAASPIDPKLAQLGDYGGPTQTMALLAGSPAIGAGIAVAGITTDQRGFGLDSPQPDIGAFQSTLVVNTTRDGFSSSPGITSLRLAVKVANVAGGGTITFDPTVFATHQTITLTSGPLELSGRSGLESIAGLAAGVTIDAAGKSRVVQVDAGVTASLSGLTITGGSGIFGGGLENAGMVTVSNSAISGNSATIGGGVDNRGTATLTNCTVSGNQATSIGGGVYSPIGGGPTTLTNCTVSGNSAQSGGGLSDYGTATLTGCTVSGNQASGAGGGVYIYSGTFAPGNATISDTIIAGNSAGTGPDVRGTVSADRGYNLISIGDGSAAFTAPGDQVGSAASPIDPKLAKLGDYGGPTQTMALLAGSPAIGAGIAVAGITTDQRGFGLDLPQPDIGAFQSTLVVNTTRDGFSSSPGIMSLRLAVTVANVAGGGTITFDPTVFAAHQTITLTSGPLELSAKGGLESIAGPAAGVTIDAAGKSRVFLVDQGVTASLSALTITGGLASATNGGGLENAGTITLTNSTISGNSAGFGGGVDNRGTATLTNCTVSGNSASRAGGGMYNVGTATFTNCTISGNQALVGGGLASYRTATLTNCTVSGNSASRAGGGMDNVGTATFTNCTISRNQAPVGGGLADYGTATLTNCTVSGNQASGAGGGLADYGTATLTNCTVSGNSASRAGGGIDNGVTGTATFTNCTISGNEAFIGGGLASYRTATLTNCTISGNQATSIGGGVYNYYLGGDVNLTDCTVSGNSAQSGGGVYIESGLFYPGITTISDTIIAGNSAGTGPDVRGLVWANRGYNLIGIGDGSDGFGAAGDQVGSAARPIDPLLATLGDYGGPTQTMALLPGSPAINAGSATLAVDPSTGRALTADQRGYTPSSMADIGAFQDQGFTLTPVNGTTPQSATVAKAFANPLAVTVTAQNTSQFINPVDGGVIHFKINPAASGASAHLSTTTATISNGQASVTATANTIAGSYSVTASVAGVTTPASFNLTNNPGAAASVAVISGSGQAATVAQGFASPLVVVVKDSYGNLVPGASVTFAAPASGASAALTGSPATTGVNGEASVTATANTTAGGYTVTASVTGVTTPATFSLANNPGAAASVAVVSGSGQAATVAQGFTTPVVVVVDDSYGNLVPGVSVTFAAPASGASATLSSAMATTAANGQASVTATANAYPGSYSVTASVTGVMAPASFALTQTLPATGVSVIGTTLFIVGGSTSSDTATINPAGAGNDGTTGLAVNAKINGVSSSKSFTQPFTAIIIAGYAGKDSFTLAPSLTLPTTVTAGDGKDTIKLGGGNNAVTLGNGNDSVSAGGGNNAVMLGNGNDTTTLGNGSNVVVEGNGSDSVTAGNGNNLIVGGLGKHTIKVGNGTNILIDGSATVNNSRDSFRQILSAWTANPTASNQAAIRSRFTVNYNAKYPNTLSAGSGIDWFFYQPSTTSNKKPTDFLN